MQHSNQCFTNSSEIWTRLMELRNCILCIILMWSLFCSVRVYINLYFLPILFVKLGFRLSALAFHVFTSLVLSFYYFCSSFCIQCYLKRLNNILYICFYKNRVIKNMLPERFVYREKCHL